MFCVFLRFRNLPELKLTWNFSGINILSREPSRAQEVNEGGHEGQTSTGGVGPRPGHPTPFGPRGSDVVHLRLLALSLT
jgi:hypothetical protein